MAKRTKQYRIRMSEEEFIRLEHLSNKLNMPKSKVIRLAIKSADMSLIVFENHREMIKEAYESGNTHAVYVGKDNVKST